MFGEIKKLFAGLICASMIFSSAPAPTYAAKATKTKTVSKVKGKSTKKKSSKKKKTTSKSPTKQTSTNGAAPFHVTNLPANMLTIKKGKSKTISIKMNGKKMSKSTTLKKVKWSSSNKKIVTVTSKGKLKAKKKGKANVTIALKSNKKRKIVIAVTVGTPVSKVQLSQGSMVVTLHQSKSLTASVLPVNASNKGIIWRSKNNAIATVNNGIVYGVNKGSVGIEAIAADGSGRKATANITVADDNYSTQPTQPKPQPAPTNTTVSPTGVSVSESSVSLNYGESKNLSASITPSNATNKTIKWSSSNSSVVSVEDYNSYSVIHAVGTGTATITATSDANHSIKATTTVTVSNPSSDTTIYPASITLSEYNVALNEDDDLSLYAYISPDNATNKNIDWSTSDSSIVSIEDHNSYADLHAEGTGIVTITAKSEADPSVSVSTKVTVSSSSDTTIDPTSITLTDENDVYYSSYGNISMSKGSSKYFTASVYPSDATNKNLTWSSTDSDVVKVEDYGSSADINAVGTGTATVKVTSDANDSVYATLNVTVSKSSDTTIDPTSISLSTNKVNLNDGEETTISATISPDNATNQNIDWSTSDSSIVSIEDHNSYVDLYAKKPGTAIITATSEANSDVVAFATVTVSKSTDLSTDPTSITLTNSNDIPYSDNANTSMIVGDTTDIYANIDTTDEDKRGIKWESDDESIVKINRTGTYVNSDKRAAYADVEAKSTGTATITAKSTYDNSICARLKITVKRYATDMSISDGSNIYKDGDSFSMDKTDTKTLTASLSPDDVTENDVKWSSSNTDVADVTQSSSDSLKCELEAKSAGTTNITVSVNGTGNRIISMSIKVYVTSDGTINVRSQSDLEYALNKGYDNIKLNAYTSYKIPEGDYSNTNLDVVEVSSLTNKGLFKNIKVERCDDFTENTPSSLGKNNFSFDCILSTNFTVSSSSHVDTVTISSKEVNIIDDGSIDEINIDYLYSQVTLKGATKDASVKVNLKRSGCVLKSDLPLNLNCQSDSTIYLNSANVSATQITASDPNYIPTIYGSGSYNVKITSTGTIQTVYAVTANSIINGTVKDATSKNALSGITVRLYEGSDHNNGYNYIREKDTDSSGEFSFDSLPAGDYTVWLEDSRYEVSSDNRMVSKSVNFTVAKNEWTSKIIYMSQKSSDN